MVALFTFVNLAGGLCFFLFGMHMLSKGLEKYAGAKMQALIERMTNNRIKGFLVGILTTAVLQSSSMTMLTLIGLINAGLMTHVQAVGVILGTEIGTTVTAQLVAFEIGEFYMIPIILGFIFYFSSKKFSHKYLGQAILGFGLLFMGMSIMSASMAPLADEPFFVDILSYMSVNIFLAMFFGAVFTAVIQSSSAMVGTVIAMSMSGIISLPAAIGIMLGANIGTTITSFIGSLGASISAKRAAASQIVINIMGVLIMLPFVFQYASFIQLTSPNLPRQIANAHTVFNVIMSLLFLPFSTYIVAISKKLVPGKEEVMVDVRSMRKEEILKSPGLALRYAEKELEKVLKMTIGMLKNSRKALLESDTEAIKRINKTEPDVDKLRYVIEDFLEDVKWADATEEQLRQRLRIAHNTTDMERVGDLAENIANYSREKNKQKISFSKMAVAELRNMFRKVIDSYVSASRAVTERNHVLASKAVMLEDEVDKLYWEYRERHVRRLQEGVCDPRAEEIFTNSMRDLERISDHADNIAKSILHQENSL